MSIENSDKINIKLITSQEELNLCFDIRHKVFVQEQECPFNEEFDELDQKAEHFLLKYGEKPAATARMYKDAPQTAKIGRVGVYKEYRKMGLGKEIMQYIINYCHKSGCKNLILHAQTRAIPFYEKLGFEKFGEEFMESGIPHYKMELKF